MDDNAQDYIYSFRLHEDKIKKMKAVYTVLCFLLVVATYAVGFVETYSTKYILVTVPYVMLFLPEAITLISCFNIIGMVDIMSYKTYKKGFLWLSKLTKFILICDCICVGAECSVLIFDRDITDISNEIVFLAGIIITLIADAILFIYHKNNIKHIVKYKTSKKEEKGERQHE